jgi:dTDP-4-dehydrorhamnose reductase
VSVVADQVGTPTYAGDLADAMLKILAHPVWAPGIYHFSNEGVCSWYDFARKIMEMGGCRCTLHPITTDQYPTRATRPAYSVLDKTKIKQAFGLRIPAWEESLTGCVRALTTNL